MERIDQAYVVAYPSSHGMSICAKNFPGAIEWTTQPVKKPEEYFQTKSYKYLLFQYVMNFPSSTPKIRRKIFTFAPRTSRCFVCVTIVRRYGTAERTFFPWADGMKVQAEKDIHPGKKKKRMDARAEIGDFGLIFAYQHRRITRLSSGPARLFHFRAALFPSGDRAVSLLRTPDKDAKAFPSRAWRYLQQCLLTLHCR
jgi:hypothetical protein